MADTTMPTALPTQAPMFQGQPYQALSSPWIGFFSSLLGSSDGAAGSIRVTVENTNG